MERIKFHGSSHHQAVYEDPTRSKTFTWTRFIMFRTKKYGPMLLWTKVYMWKNYRYQFFIPFVFNQFRYSMSVSSTKGQWYFPNAPYSWRSAHCFWPLSTPPTPPPWRLWRGTERGATVALAAKVFSGGVLQLATGKHHAMAIHLGGFLIIGIIYNII